VSEAFGEFWGFQESYWSYASGTVDTALYPVLVYSTIFSDEQQASMEWYYSYLFKFGLLVLFTIPNLLQLRIVGKGLFLMTGVVLLPFIVLMVIGIPKANWSNLLGTTSDDFTIYGLTVRNDNR
jgi:amino acid transporter